MTVAEWLVARDRPGRVLGWAACAALVFLWGALRLVVFHDVLFPLTYVLPLMIGLWTCNVRMVWTMAAAFGALAAAEFRILPREALGHGGLWPVLLPTLFNIVAGATVVHLGIRLRSRLEDTIRALRDTEEEVRAQAEELAQQNEELQSQGEELAQQNEELQAQSEEVFALNQELRGREALLARLIEAWRRPGSTAEALERVCASAVDLVGSPAVSAVVFERRSEELVARARCGEAAGPPRGLAFARLTLLEGRVAALEDGRLRPELAGPGTPAPSLLCAPVVVRVAPAGALLVAGGAPHGWTEDQFRLLEWLAARCAEVIETERLHDEQRAAEAQLREEARRKSEFLATLSHELRNPLAPIRYALELLRADRRPGAAASDALRVIDRQLSHLARLVDDLLDVTRIASNKIRLQKGPVPLEAVLHQALEAVRPAIDSAGHALALRLPETPLVLDGDADRLAQVFTNLLNNAARYTPPSGRLEVSAQRQDGAAVVTVSDSGIGLGPQDLDRVFDMFTQVGGPGRGGLGIGLSLVKGIVELHGGRVEAHSDGDGRGSRFSVRLPLAASQALAGAPAADAAPGHARARRVLVVDDNADAADMMHAILELQGHEVCVARDGRSALEALARFSPDVALLDIGLPGMDGYELARRLREHPACRRAFLVAITGWGQEEDRRRAREAGFDAHLTKPADPAEVARLVAAAQPSSGGVN